MKSFLFISFIVICLFIIPWVAYSSGFFGGGGGGGVTDHGALSGLGDDDHSIYHTDSRGDARYFTETELGSSTASSGSDLIGDDNTYSNFTPAATTIKGAFSGIDTALGAAGGDPISGATDNALVRADGATGLQDAPQWIIDDSGFLVYSPTDPTSGKDYWVTNMSVPELSGNYRGQKIIITSTGVGIAQGSITGYRVEIPAGQFSGGGDNSAFSVDNRAQSSDGADAADQADTVGGVNYNSFWGGINHNDGRRVHYMAFGNNSAKLNFGFHYAGRLQLDAGEIEVGVQSAMRFDADGTQAAGHFTFADPLNADTYPTKTAALIADNDTASASIFLGLENHLVVFDIKNGGDVEIAKSLSLLKSDQVVDEDDETVTTLNRSFILLDSNNVTSTLRTIVIDAGADGQLLTICADSSAFASELLDSGIVKIAGLMTFGADDCISLVSDGTDWRELSRSIN